MDDIKTKRARLLIKKITKGGYSLSGVEKNLVLYIAKLETRIRKLEAINLES